MSDKKLHMIGNAHLDPVWLWQWQEGFQETKATFRSAIDRLNEYDDFVFTSSSAVMYEWVEKNDPSMFEEIKEKIQEGRWVICGGWWLQPDCNIPSGESFVRQGLYGQRYFKEKFGVTATVGYNVDSFGHNGMLPQILQKSGMEHYVFMRPGPHEKGLPGRLFWWESDDGSRVMTFQIPFEYTTWGQDLDEHINRCSKELKEPVDELMSFYGVGNHGGGPTKENIESIKRLNKEDDLPELLFSSPNQFFEEIKTKNINLPSVHHDLQNHAKGCYSVHSGIKKWNREAESLLAKSEKLSVLADHITGQPYPADYKLAWKNVMFNQFHDILAGTSLEEAYEDARNMHGEAMTIAERNLNYAVQSLAWNIDIEEDENMLPIVVFNPHAWSVKQNIEVEFKKLKEDQILVDEKGNPVPLQVVQSSATANGRNRLSFIANLPSMGYRVYKVISNRKLDQTPTIKANDYVMENDRYRLEFNPKTGFISSLFDKNQEYEMFTGDAGRAVVINDHSDTWSHDVVSYKDVAGEFDLRSMKLVEHGPVKSVIRIISEFGNSKLTQDFTMYHELHQIDVKAVVDWREKFKMLKLTYPVNLVHRKATYEIPYGHIIREANGEEQTGQSWIDVSGTIKATGGRYGLSLLNDSKYSYDVEGNEVSLTVLRSPIYAHHDPLVPDPDGHYSFIDQGIQKFNYSLLPHEDSWEEAQTVRRAAEFNQSSIALIETYHKGDLPQINSFMDVDQSNIIVSAIKQAEDNEDMIIRLYETNKITTKTTITLSKWNRKIEAEFGPCEIKTFRVPKDQDKEVIETNMLEWQE
ncbi:alpha-mannosidase [Gracilibacillus salitolerans]|uniref:Alpha-mannosidase n=1 Tax=Gracilibacillus salitolerans TaxID=2663022 RepID=A0A5Q2TGB5_9BACI|nr:glycoside hydrolase family 38 C-terminal domain-containing protein [Gracilibacillus salitolerans]QGH33655.1 alpha-mannosidase [Gracilibacillus salitolerans]